MTRLTSALLSWALLAAVLLAAPAALGAPAGEPLAVSNARHHRSLSWALGDTWYPGAILGAVKDAIFGGDQGSSSSSPSSSSPSSYGSPSQQQPSYSPTYNPSIDGSDNSKSKGGSDGSDASKYNSGSDSSKSKGVNADDANASGGSSKGNSSPQQTQQQPATDPSSSGSTPGYYAGQAKPSPSPSSSSSSPAPSTTADTTKPASGNASAAPSTNSSSKLDPTNVDQVQHALESLGGSKKSNGTAPATSNGSNGNAGSNGKNGTSVGSSVPASTVGHSIPAPVPTSNATKGTNGTTKGAAIDPANVDQVAQALKNINSGVAKGSPNATNPSSTTPRISSSPLPSAPNTTNTNSTKNSVKTNRRALYSSHATASSSSARHAAAHRRSTSRKLRGFAGVSDGGSSDLSSNILGTVDQQVQQALSNSGINGNRQGNTALPAGTQQQQYVPQQQAQQQQQYVPQQQAQQGSLNSEQQDALSLHNNFRARHGSPALTYSTELESSARAWAQQLANECGFRHSGPGENLASGYNSWGEVVKAWYDEISMYNFNNPSFSHQTGHFTQVVWAATTTVGCATARSSSCWEGTIFACHYRPYGNVNSAQYFRDNVRQPVASS